MNGESELERARREMNQWFLPVELRGREDITTEAGRCFEAVARLVAREEIARSDLASASAGGGEAGLCSDCPPVGYDHDRTRCLPCPRRPAPAHAAPEAGGEPASTQLQRHRDAWRSYAYGKSDKPTDFLDGNMSDRQPTRVETLEAERNAAIREAVGLREAMEFATTKLGHAMSFAIGDSDWRGRVDAVRARLTEALSPAKEPEHGG